VIIQTVRFVFVAALIAGLASLAELGFSGNSDGVINQGRSRKARQNRAVAAFDARTNAS
jgi:hypothetical protein